MKASEIRSRFLKYFEKNGHAVIDSSSLVPSNDPTLLFTNAGMVQFKDVFLGKDPRSYTRAATSQKCVRAGGKHNDLENVGFTARHHTFFEMLGNFSFGDYFKKEAIHFAWELVTKELGLPKDKLYVTVFETDDEAADIWHKQEGIPKDRIYRFGEKDNFWSMGETGPCGPCSEIFIDRGEKHGCGKPTCKMGCDCDRFMEFWNLVFMQYDRSADGKLTPLPKPSVDTGAGLERLASILQNVDTNYDTDIFQTIIAETSALAGRPYLPGSPEAFSFRVIADHSRATAFLIGDGVMPSNEGRGYVLRRIMRRAIRHGRKLGFQGPFLHKTAGFVIDQMQGAYPDLVDKRAFIARAVQAEEEQFLKTLERGLALLDEETAKPAQGRTLPGEIAFKLYDTYGFPLDLTRVICAEKGITVDEAGFETAMDRQRAESRKNWKGTGQAATEAVYLQLAAKLRAEGKMPEFVGYDGLRAEGKCVAILKPGVDGGLVAVDEVTATAALAATKDSADSAEVIEAVFSVTPFYGESGGQAGDRGRVTGQGLEAEVVDVQKPAPDLIVAHLKLKRGSLKVGNLYNQETAREIRALTARNHTATHLLHWALREKLGKHVKQAGSVVGPDLLRFDFTHFEPLTQAQIRELEDMINAKIWSHEPVSKQVMEKDAAVASGAIAFFGEKYGEQVRVIRVGDFSTELCGGTHVDNAGEIHAFKIVSEGSIAAGVRRVIAQTSRAAFETLRTRDDEMRALREKLKAATASDVQAKIEKLQASERDLRKALDSIHSKGLTAVADEMLAKSVTLKAGRLVVGIAASSAEGMKTIRDLNEKILAKAPDAIAVIGIEESGTGKAALLVSRGSKAPSAFHSGELLKELAPLIDGKGGGKPELAQAGGAKPSGLPSAMDRAKAWVAAKF